MLKIKKMTVKNLIVLITALFILSSCSTEVKTEETEKETVQEDTTKVETEQDQAKLEKLQKIEELIKNTKKENLPFAFDDYDVEKAYNLDLEYHSYLKEFFNLDNEKQKFKTLCYLELHKDFYTILIESRFDNNSFDDNYNDIKLYSISKIDGEITKLNEELFGYEGSGITVNFSKDGEITILEQSHPDDDFSLPLKSIETKFKMDENGKFVKTQEAISYFNKFIDDFSIEKRESELTQESINNFYSITSSKDIAYFIKHSAEQIVMMLQYGIDTHKSEVEDPKELSYLSELFPGLVVGYGAEGSGIEVRYDYYRLSLFADNTPEKDDDLFFEAYANGNEIYEDYESKRNYLLKFSAFECSDFETCYSLLGGGKCYGALLKIENALKLETNFKEPFALLKESILQDLEMSDTNYGYSKEKTLKYLEKIQTEITLNEKEAKLFQAIKESVNSKANSFFNYTNKQ